MDNKTLNLIAAIKKEFPKFSIQDKNKSVLMKFLYYISFMFIWNRNFMNDYITTSGNTVYAPGGNVDWSTLAHEFVHIYDYNKRGRIVFALAYGFPQILAAFSLLAIFAVFSPWFLMCLLFLLFLLPLPAPFREEIEMRGYAANMLGYYLRYPDSLLPYQDYVIHSMWGWGYYNMTWDFHDLTAKVLSYKIKILNGELEKQLPYSIIADSVE